MSAAASSSGARGAFTPGSSLAGDAVVARSALDLARGAGVQPGGPWRVVPPSRVGGGPAADAPHPAHVLAAPICGEDFVETLPVGAVGGEQRAERRLQRLPLVGRGRRHHLQRIPRLGEAHAVAVVPQRADESGEPATRAGADSDSAGPARSFGDPCRISTCSDALRRRCLYHYVDFPDVAREAQIILARLPGIDAALAAQVARMVGAIRKEDLRKVPGVAETLDWAATLAGLGVHDLRAEPEAVHETMIALLKTHEDRLRVTPEVTERLLGKVA